MKIFFYSTALSNKKYLYPFISPFNSSTITQIPFFSFFIIFYHSLLFLHIFHKYHFLDSVLSSTISICFDSANKFQPSCLSRYSQNTMSAITEAIFCTESVVRLQHKPTIHERFPCCGHLVPRCLKLTLPSSAQSAIISNIKTKVNIKLEGRYRLNSANLKILILIEMRI